MKVLHLGLAVAILAGLYSSAVAQQAMYGQPGMMPAAYGQPNMGYPQMMPPAYPQQAGYSPMMAGGNPQMMSGGYPQAMPAGYAQMDPGAMQQAMYGSPGPMSGGPMPMDGGGYGAPCGPEGCPGGCPSCQGHCYDDGGMHYVYGSAEVFYARRTNQPNPQPIVETTASPGSVITSTRDFDFGYQPGIKATAGYYFSNGWGVEGTYFGDFDLRSGIIVTDPAATLTLPGSFGTNGVNFGSVDRFDLSYTSRVHNAELNFILPYGSIQYLAGFRYFEMDENLSIVGTDSALGTSSSYTVQTGNHLFGGQLGARTQWEVGRFVFDAECKGGVFSNAAEQFQSANDPGLANVRSNGAHEKQTAFIGEVAAYLFYPMGSHFTARLGYTAVWIDDLALATDQLNFNDTATGGSGIDTRGSTIIHGFNAGVEARW
jgi:hypothetical protein